MPSVAVEVTHASQVFRFDNIKYTVPTSNGDKQILKGIKGVVKSGEVLAVMGPSGAGKTMLLNVLTLVPGPGTRTGNLTLNGVTLSEKAFSTHAAVVTQADQQWAFLTCRETVQYASDLYSTSSAAERATQVDKLIDLMGLSGCADTKVGNQFMAGLSGGQRRRLSLATAVIKDPALLFLDEPTSGLDAAAALSIMNFIKELSTTRNMCVFATIHQPSSEVYDTFDQLMVLSDGRIAYAGPAESAITYFADMGFPAPEHSNPADFFLNLVNREFTDPKSVDKLLDMWVSAESKYGSESNLKALDDSDDAVAADNDNSSLYRTGLFSQIGTLLRRQSLLIGRDPTLYVGRMVMFLFSCAFFAVIYIQARKRVQEQALYRLFLLMWFIGVPSSLGVIAVFAMNLEFNAIKREVKDGMVRPVAYFISNAILQLPLCFVMGIFAMSVPGYGIAGFNGEAYLAFLCVYSLTLWSFECMAQFFSIQFDNPLLGMLMYMNMWFSAFLFAGVMVPEEDVIWPFRAFCYSLPLRWSLTGMAKVEFSGTTFRGAVPYHAGDENSTDASLRFPYGEEDPWTTAEISKGFKCDPNVPMLACNGYTGDQVLDSIGQNYKSIGSENNVFRDTMFIVIIGIVFKLQFLVFMVMKLKSAKPPVPEKALKAA